MFVTVFCIFHSNFRFTVNIVSVVIITCYHLFAIVVIEVVVLIFDVKFQFNNTLQYNTIQYNIIQYNTYYMGNSVLLENKPLIESI